MGWGGRQGSPSPQLCLLPLLAHSLSSQPGLPRHPGVPPATTRAIGFCQTPQWAVPCLWCPQGRGDKDQASQEGSLGPGSGGGGAAALGCPGKGVRPGQEQRPLHTLHRQRPPALGHRHLGKGGRALSAQEESASRLVATAGLFFLLPPRPTPCKGPDRGTTPTPCSAGSLRPGGQGVSQGPHGGPEAGLTSRGSLCCVLPCPQTRLAGTPPGPPWSLLL